MADIEKRDALAQAAVDKDLKSDAGSLKPSSSIEKEQDEEAAKARILQQLEDQKELEPKQTTSFKDLFKRQTPIDLDQNATKASVFDDPVTAKYFQPHEKYENRHRFDPSARWTHREERSIVRKIDWRITVWACIAFFGLDLGRGNLSQANTDEFLPSLGMGTNDYNLGITVYQISFLLAELPSQMISKRLGPDRWIPFIMCSWSIVSAAQFWLSGRTSFLVCRAILGMLQGGFIPDIILYLTYFFKGTELPFRLAIFWTVRRVTDIIAPLLAFGVLRMRGLHGREGWRWLFLIEGIIMLCIGIWSWFMMVASPTQTKAWFRKDGWFNEREETIMTNRILRDDPSKGDMHNRQAITLPMLWNSLCDFDLWPIYLFGLIWEMPSGPPDIYFTLTLRRLNFDTFQANLLTIPTQAAGAITLLAMTYVSERVNQRALFGAFTQLWCLPNLIAIAVLPSSTSPWTQFAVLTVLLSFPSPHAIHVGWASKNSNSVRTRAVSAALYNMMVQLSRVVYANIYQESDEPEYRNGNRALVGICCANICIYALAKAYYMYRNWARDKEWGAMSQEERVHYLETTKDTGSKRKDTRFVH